MTKPTEDKSPVLSLAYYEGRRAHREGRRYADNPETDSLKRLDWFQGFEDSECGVSVEARVEAELNAVEKKFKPSYV